jgi:hypothetical protein
MLPPGATLSSAARLPHFSTAAYAAGSYCREEVLAQIRAAIKSWRPGEKEFVKH